jgi:hypothetical protein
MLRKYEIKFFYLKAGVFNVHLWSCAGDSSVKPNSYKYLTNDNSFLKVSLNKYWRVTEERKVNVIIESDFITYFDGKPFKLYLIFINLFIHYEEFVEVIQIFSRAVQT